MNTVYVIASVGRDSYTAMARISIASLRWSNSNARIVVVCDRQSDQLIRAANDPILGEVDEWLAYKTPPGDGSFRSKFLKSSLRQRMSGPFLFLDVDTIVRDDLSFLFQVAGDIAGAPNHSREEFARQVWAGDQAILSAMQWSTRDTFYVNSGVLLASESEGAHRVYQLWHDHWQRQQTRLHDSRDQPSLNTAIRESDIYCERLDCRYNAQIGANPLSMRDAAVWHYYYSLNYQAHSFIEELIQRVIQTQQVDTERLRNLMEAQRLWPKEYWTSGPGIYMVNGAVRDLVRCVEIGQGPDDLLHAMWRTDPVFARQVLAKTLADSFWSDKPAAYRFARLRVLKTCPLELLRPAVRRCFIHEFYRRLRPGKR